MCITARVSSRIASNNLHVKQIESIHVNRVAQVPPRGIWQQRQRKKVYSSMDCTARDDMSGSDAHKRLMTVASIVQGLHWRLMPLLDNHHTSRLTYRPWCKRLNQGKKPFNARFSILDDKKTLQLCGNASCSRLEVAIPTRPHPEKQSIISWWHMLSPPCGPSATNEMNCLLLAVKRHHENFYKVVVHAFCIVETTEIQIVIDVVCEVGKSLETPSNVIL